MTSSIAIGRCRPSSSCQVIPTSVATHSATTSASSRERGPFPVWGVGSQRTPEPDRTGIVAVDHAPAGVRVGLEQPAVEGR